MQRGGTATGGYQAQRRRRIGKKAMAISRTAMLLERKAASTKAKPAHRPRRKLALPSITWRPRKIHYVILAGVIIIALIGTGGLFYYQQRAAAQRRVEQAAAQERARTASKKSNDCRAQKVATKPDQWGKVTYDQMYDYTVCDYSE